MNTTPPPLTPPPPPRPGWWSRNWKWFVPVGCVSLAAVFVAFVLAIVVFAFGIIKSSEPYKESLARAKNHPAVIAALGSPVEEGFWTMGGTESNPASGTANLSIPLSGPKGKGKLYVTANKTAGEWNYEQIVLELQSTKERIDLMAEDDSRL